MSHTTHDRPREDGVSRTRVSIEFGALLTLGLVGYVLQDVSDVGTVAAGLVFYLAFAFFFWKRGGTLAAMDGQLIGALLGDRLGRASATVAGVAFPAIGLAALLALPIALIAWAVASWL